MDVLTLVFAFGALVVLFNGLWAMLARAQGYPYGALFWVSWLIYAAAGFVAGQHRDLLTCAGIGAGVAGIEATLGWALAAAIGPGRPARRLTAGVLGQTIVLVILAGELLGLG